MRTDPDDIHSSCSCKASSTVIALGACVSGQAAVSLQGRALIFDDVCQRCVYTYLYMYNTHASCYIQNFNVTNMIRPTYLMHTALQSNTAICSLVG